MRCDNEKCHHNGDGYCCQPSYVRIDANGECDQMFVLGNNSDNQRKCDWVIDQVRELKALLSHGENVTASNKTRALSGIDTAIASLNELREHIEKLQKE
jgi:hypothetical protein